MSHSTTATTTTITYPSDAPPVRIDRFLADRLTGLSRSHIKRLILDKTVLCNGEPVKPSHKTGPGDIITVTIPAPEPIEVPPENIPLDILYQDADIAVINKPAGIIVHPAGTIMTGTLVNALLYHIDQLSGINGVLRPGIVHRLDKDTTGVMLIAKNDRSHRHLAGQFESRSIEKQYIALVWGHFPEPEGIITKSIARSRSDRTKMVSGHLGRKSATAYRVIREYDFLSLVEAEPRTGRTHQIRSHFASIGHPVFGDRLYRGRNRRLDGLTAAERSFAARLLQVFLRQALHANGITLEHPSTGERIAFTAPPPADLAGILEILNREL